MRSKLEKLTAKEIEAITKKTRKNRKTPLVISRTPQVILDQDLNAKIEVLSAAQGVSSDKFVQELLKEDVDRLWRVYKKAV